MASITYQKTGDTIRITANATPGTGNITVANASSSFGNAGGPVYIKVDNTNNANVDVFLNWGPNSNVTATIANATSSGSGVCIQHGATEYIKVQNPTISTGLTTIYFAAASSAASQVYITPISIEQ